LSLLVEPRLDELRLDEVGTAPDLDDRELLLLSAFTEALPEDDDDPPVALRRSLLEDDEEEGRLLVDEDEETEVGRPLLDELLGRDEELPASREVEDLEPEPELLDEDADLEVEERLIEDRFFSSGGGRVLMATTCATWFHSSTQL
jgi:hypothetical protein